MLQNLYIEIIRTQVNYKSNNVFSQVKSGSIYIKGKLFRIVVDDLKSCSTAIWADCLIDTITTQDITSVRKGEQGLALDKV